MTNFFCVVITLSAIYQLKQHVCYLVDLVDKTYRALFKSYVWVCIGGSSFLDHPSLQRDHLYWLIPSPSPFTYDHVYVYIYMICVYMYILDHPEMIHSPPQKSDCIHREIGSSRDDPITTPKVKLYI